MPRFFCPVSLSTGDVLHLPAGAARHVQVLRLQPGAPITLFNGQGGEYAATVLRMGRSDVEVQVGAHQAIEREAPRDVHLLVGSMANERMDWLVEKATELGAASITPLLLERSVLKLKGERADKKRAHWQAVAVAACEQCGRNRVPQVHAALTLTEWLAHPHARGLRCMLSLAPGATPWSEVAAWPGGAPAEALARAVSTPPKNREASPLPTADMQPLLVLSGPEGGLSPAEQAQALAQGFVPVSLGPRVLRAETAPLVVLAGLPGLAAGGAVGG